MSLLRASGPVSTVEISDVDIPGQTLYRVLGIHVIFNQC